MKIKSEERPSSSSPTRVKIAADKSMALAVGSRRAWSRAMLWKIHHQHKAAAAATRRRRRVVSVRRIINNNIHHHKRSLRKRCDHHEGVGGGGGGGFCHANELRKLVPGGETMDLCSLLDETAHYLKCLVTQVQVMTSIGQFCSAI